MGSREEPDKKDEQEATDEPPHLHFYGSSECGHTVGQELQDNPDPGRAAAPWSSLCPRCAPWSAEWRLRARRPKPVGARNIIYMGVFTTSALRVLCVFNQASEEQGHRWGDLCELEVSHKHTHAHIYIDIHTPSHTQSTHRDIHMHPCVNLLFFYCCN